VLEKKFPVCLALMETVQERLLKESFEGVMKLLRALPTAVDADRVIDRAMHFKFTTREILEIEEEFTPANATSGRWKQEISSPEFAAAYEAL
jgi:hypothetical protein